LQIKLHFFGLFRFNFVEYGVLTLLHLYYKKGKNMGYEGKKALVVDEPKVMRQIIINFLKELGFSDPSEANKEKIMEAVQAGVNQYIVKPFNAMKLEEKINTIKL
jgi:hypothetical protein